MGIVDKMPSRASFLRGSLFISTLINEIIDPAVTLGIDDLYLYYKSF